MASREFSEREVSLLRGAYRKLDAMPMSFGVPQYNDTMTDADVSKYMGGDLIDVMRELGISNLDGVAEFSTAELQIENRIVYYALKRFRHSASVFFKFSTAVDGKTVDKQQIPKMLAEMLKEYQDEWTKYKASLATGQMQLWQMESNVRTNGEYSTSSS